MAIEPGRITHDHDGNVVVFLIGMRINRLRAVRAWWPVIQAMPRMLRELDADPSLGLLGYRQCVSGRGTLAVQYWRDLDSLLGYAQATNHAHRPAWAAFNRSVRDAAGAVGIWHETFVVPAGGHESLYVGMPSVGLPAVYGPVPVSTKRDAARERLSRA
jgi:hypothetical protein